MEHCRYSSVPIWNEIPKYLPPGYRIDDSNVPEEVYWQWGGNAIHLDHYHHPASKAKVILLHGVGGNGRLLSFIAAPLHRQGYEIIVPDLPGYGLSVYQDGIIDYQVWIRLVNDLIRHEQSRDPRPIVLFGFSAGGMLAYHTACINKQVAGIIATNLLDQRLPEVRERSAIHPIMARIAIPLLKGCPPVFQGLKLPMKALVNMRAIVNDSRLVKLLIKDRTSSGAMVTIKFVLSLIETAPEIEPEEFQICPVLLVHPGDDRWTPLELSRLFFDRISGEKELMVLENAGHFPIEQPGLGQMESAVITFLQRVQ